MAAMRSALRLASPARLAAVLAVVVAMAGASCQDSALPYYHPTDLAVEMGPPDLSFKCPKYWRQFDARCTSNLDCTVGMHQLDCCGNIIAFGIAASALMDFTVAEASCQQMIGPKGPMCIGCGTPFTQADDGHSRSAGMRLGIGCIKGTCASFIN